jgi:chemotaxis protein histidine kinase CheA
MIESSSTKATYSGDGKTTAFPYAFKLNAAADMHVAIYNSADETTTELTSDYYVDTAAKVVHYPGYASGQEPALSEQPPVLPAGKTITIYRETDVDQLTDLGSKYPLPNIEDIADKLTMIAQELKEKIARSVKTSVSDTETPEERYLEMQTYVSETKSSAVSAASSASAAAASASNASISATAAAASDTDAKNQAAAAAASAQTAADKSIYADQSASAAAVSAAAAATSSSSAAEYAGAAGLSSKESAVSATTAKSAASQCQEVIDNAVAVLSAAINQSTIVSIAAEDQRQYAIANIVGADGAVYLPTVISVSSAQPASGTTIWIKTEG